MSPAPAPHLFSDRIPTNFPAEFSANSGSTDNCPPPCQRSRSKTAHPLSHPHWPPITSPHPPRTSPPTPLRRGACLWISTSSFRPHPPQIHSLKPPGKGLFPLRQPTAEDSTGTNPDADRSLPNISRPETSPVHPGPRLPSSTPNLTKHPKSLFLFSNQPVRRMFSPPRRPPRQTRTPSPLSPPDPPLFGSPSNLKPNFRLADKKQESAIPTTAAEKYTSRVASPTPLGFCSPPKQGPTSPAPPPPVPCPATDPSG